MFQRAKNRVSAALGLKRHQSNSEATDGPQVGSQNTQQPVPTPSTNGAEDVPLPHSEQSSPDKSDSPIPFPLTAEPTVATQSDRFLARPASVSRHASHASRSSHYSRKQSIPYAINGPINVPNGENNYNAADFGPGPSAGSLARPYSDNDADELQPLLNRLRGNSYSVQSVVVQPQEHETHRMFSSWYKDFTLDAHRGLVTLIVMLLLLLLFFYLTYNQLDSLAVQAIETSIHSISILKVHSDGVDLHVIGSLTVNYDNISNRFYRTFMKLGSVLLGSVLITPQGPVKLTVALLSDESLKPLHVLDIYPPELQVDILNKRITEIDFISKTDVVEDSVVQLANRALALHDKSIAFACQGSVDLYVKTSLFQYEAQNVHFNETIVLKRDDIEPDVVVQSILAGQVGNAITLNTLISIENTLPMNFALAPIDWDVLFEGCDGVYPVGMWTSSNVTVKPNTPIVVQINGTVDSVPKELLERCEKNGLSSINKAVKRYAAGQSVSVQLRASAGNKHLPPWFLYIAHNVNYKFLFDPVLPLVEAPKVTIGELHFEIPAIGLNSIAKSTFGALLNSNLTINMTRPFGFEIEGFVLELSTTYGLRRKNRQLFNGSANHFLDWDYNGDYVGINVSTSDDKIQVLDPKLVGSLLTRYIDGNLVGNLTLTTIFNDVHVELPIFSAVFDDITVEIPFSLDYKPELLPSVSHWNVSVLNIFILGTAENVLEATIDVQLTNPTGLTIEIPRERLGCDILFNNTVFATALLEDLYVPGHESVNCSAFAVFNLPTPDSRVNLELFASEFLSGVENLTLGLNGIADTDSQNKGLQELIGNTELSNMQLPHVKFDTSDESPNPFLLESVIHILTSEIELTLYNPVNNSEILVNILLAAASYEDTVLGHMEHHEILMVPPGVYKTPRMKLKINQGVGMDILRKAVDGSLRVNVTAAFDTTIQDFSLQLLYRGSGVAAKVRF